MAIEEYLAISRGTFGDCKQALHNVERFDMLLEKHSSLYRVTVDDEFQGASVNLSNEAEDAIKYAARIQERC